MVNKKIKLLYIVSTLRRTGPTNQLLGIINNLQKELFEIQILTLSPEPPNSMINEFLESNIDVETLGLNRIQFLVKGRKKILNYINQYSPDIIHTSGVRADVAISELKTFRNKHCMTVRNYAFDDYVSKYGKFIGNILANKSINAMKNCDYVICCSKSLRQMYEKKLTQKLYVIQNGVNIEKFRPAINQEEKEFLRNQLGLPIDKTIFLVVGSLIKRKDPLTVIKAFNMASTKNNAILVFLGDGNLMEECRTISSEFIIMKGSVNNVTDYLKASDYFISASKSEGLPNSVLEAGSSGLNLILSDIPQHKEIFSKQLNLVEFFSVGDSQGLSVKIDNAIKKIENSTINNNVYNYIKSIFSNKVMGKKYTNLYLDMLNQTEQK